MPIHWPELPVIDPVLYFAIVTAVFLVVPALFERLGVPGLIGLIVVGAAIGPNGADVLARDQVTLFLGTVGLLYLMFLVGLELDLDEFRRHRRQSVAFGLLSFAIPQALGLVVGLALGYSVAAAVLLGAMFASHTLVAYPVASGLGILKTGAVTTVLGATLLTDMLALLVLAVVAGSHQGGVGWEFWARLIGSLALFGGLVLWGVPMVSRWFFRRVASDGVIDFAFTLAALFAVCAAAEIAGIEPIIGALLAGFSLNRFIPEHSALMSRIRFASSSVFVPFFLLSVGMLVDVRAFAEPHAWAAIAALTGAILVGKGAAAKLTERLFKYESADGWVMFGLSVSHAAATMAIVVVAHQLGLFGLEVVNAVVVIILVTCLIGPWAVARWGRQLALREEQRPYEPGRAPARILIPISYPKSRDGLIDLGLLLRTAASAEPLMPLMVVREEGPGTEANVAEAERMLGHAVMRGTAASASILPLTRVDQNIASGIARAVSETRASTVIIGWDGGRAAGPQAVFGRVLDQLLARTKAQVVVASLVRPLNTVSRVVLLLPGYANRHAGFADAARAVTTIAQQLAAPIHALVVGDRIEPFERALQRIKPAPAIHFAQPTSWRGLESELEATLRADDLVVLVSARRGTLPWHPRLERLPRLLARATIEAADGAGPLLIVYPGEAAGAEATSASPVIELPDYLAPSRVIADLPRLAFDRALERLLDTEYAERPVQREVILTALVRALLEDTAELRPGVALPHVRVAGVTRPILFLGVSREGIDFPHSTQPAHVIFLLASPRESPDEHLRALSAIAGLCADEQRLNDLLGQYGLGPLPPSPA